MHQIEVNEKEEEFVIRESDIPGHLENDDGSGEGAPQNEVAQGETRPPFIAEDDYQYDQALQILKALGITASR